MYESWQTIDGVKSFPAHVCDADSEYFAGIDAQTNHFIRDLSLSQERKKLMVMFFSQLNLIFKVQSGILIFCSLSLIF